MPEPIDQIDTDKIDTDKIDTDQIDTDQIDTDQIDTDEADTLAAEVPESSAAAAVDDAVLRAALADVVTDVAGVVRLEPTLKNVISRFAGGVSRTAGWVDASPVDGITVAGSGTATNVRVDVAVGGQAKATATAIQDRVRTALTTYGREPGVISVHVLAVERV